MPDEKPASGSTSEAGGTTKTDDKGGTAAGAAGTTTAEGKGTEAGAGSTTAGAPAAYAFIVPEGGLLTKEDLAHFEKSARAQNLTQVEAQAQLQDINNTLRTVSSQWADETNADPDLGGAKLDATKQHVKLGIDFLFPPGDPHRDGFLEFINRGGAGNNIHVVRALARLGKAQREDSLVGGTGGSGQGPRAPEDVLYSSKAS